MLTVASLTCSDQPVAGVLEKKWTSVVRLQKKVLDLEAKLGEAQTEIKTPKLAGGSKDPATWIPRPPAR